MKLCSVLKTTPNYLLLGATNELSEDEFNSAVAVSLHSMNDKQKKITLNLIQWISTQDFE